VDPLWGPAEEVAITQSLILFMADLLGPIGLNHWLNAMLCHLQVTLLGTKSQFKLSADIVCDDRK